MSWLCDLAITLPNARNAVCRLEVLQPSALSALHNFQRTFHGPLMHPLTDAELAGMLGDSGCVIGAFLDRLLMAFLAIQFPGREPHTIAWDYGLSNKDLAQAVQFSGILIHPDLRGNGLHSRLIETALQLLLPATRHRYGFAAVRPENVPSVRGMLTAGLRAFARRPLYDNHDRLLFVHDGIATTRAPQWPEILCPLDAPGQQRVLFACGWQAFLYDQTARSLVFAPGPPKPSKYPTGDRP